MPHMTCAHCASPIPAGIGDCPHCGQHRSTPAKQVHAAALGLALLGLGGCDFFPGEQDLYGVSDVAPTQTDTESDTQAGTDTEDDTESADDTQ